MKVTVDRFEAIEILDSRGRPTVKATCVLQGDVRASASVPAGASTGSAEAIELRDADPRRYAGLGCRKAVANLNGPINTHLAGRSYQAQSEFDADLIQMDGRPDKSRLGANTLLAASVAFARAFAKAKRIPLYQYFADLIQRSPDHLPQLTVNLFSGGKHAGGQVPIQDVLLVPLSTGSIDVGLSRIVSVYQAAIQLIQRSYGARPLKADEGGLAPPFESIEQMFDDAVESIRLAGLTAGRDMALAVDVASSHFFLNGRYELGRESLDPEQMIDRVRTWSERWPLVSIEDGLAEEQWEHWPRLTRTVGSRALVVGDDFLCTNPQRIRRAIDSAACSALLLKVNQIGTLTEAAMAQKLAKSAGWTVIVSARSGETEDNWLADLATAWGDQIKVGSIMQSERLAKYNRLLEIERETRFPVTEIAR